MTAVDGLAAPAVARVAAPGAEELLGVPRDCARPDIALDLVRRRDVARGEWRQPAHEVTSVSWERRRLTDEANAAALRRIVAQHGWPGRGLVGENAMEAAMQLAVHAPFVEREEEPRLLDALAAAVAVGEVPPSHWAHMLDREHAHRGQPQRYGTQHWWDPETGTLRLHPVADPDGLGARRAEVGMPAFERRVELLKGIHVPTVIYYGRAS